MSTPTIPTPPSPQRQARTLRGVVLRRSGDKTITVVVTRVIRHPRYHKRMSSAKKYLVHDPGNRATAGEAVSIREIRPLSRRKRWSLVETAA